MGKYDKLFTKKIEFDKEQISQYANLVNEVSAVQRRLIIMQKAIENVNHPVDYNLQDLLWKRDGKLISIFDLEIEHAQRILSGEFTNNPLTISALMQHISPEGSEVDAFCLGGDWGDSDLNF